MMEYIASIHRRLPLLLVPEHQVYPVVQPMRYEVGLERGAMEADKLARVASSPGR